MKGRASFLGIIPAAIFAVGMTLASVAAAGTVEIAPGISLQAAIDRAAPGDVLRLEAGTFSGPVTIAKPLTLEGVAGTIIEGNGTGKVLVADAPGIVLRNLEVRGSGSRLDLQDSGIFLTRNATGALVEHNRIIGNLVGIYVLGAANSVVRDNVIEGRQNLRMNEDGNGINIWNAPGARILANDIRYGRDGIYVISSRKNLFQGNRMRDLRYAVHYMYTNDSEVSGNLSLGNHAGFVIMYSDRLKVAGNLSLGDRDKGLFLNTANSSDIGENTVRPGPEKCVFIYAANKNWFHDNWFEGCDIGIHFTAGSERNRIAGNAFVGNKTQVKYVGTRVLDWSDKGHGNYWSDNPAFDLNGDGVADTAYKPNDMVDEILWVNPNAKMLLNSPAVQVVRWAQAQFPALYPGGVVDSAPLMAPPAIEAPAWKGGAQ
ncbi:nitrous oxide reductase family maturation protein NosD [Dongia sp.]|uniref:nitrous oxide reductase family maturation protein NosD n=1 Tax=Dongia sp. TaxID=1977262 RepID=UPI003753C45D